MIGNATLSTIEVQVIAGFARGRSNVAIGIDLHLSLAGVKAHARHIMEVTGCRSRAAVVDYGYRHGHLAGLKPEQRRPVWLTPQQEQVMRHLPSDLMVDEIAKEVGVTPDAAKGRMTTLYRRLRVSDRAHAVAICWQLGFYTGKRPT